jgi:hypothetical protein
MSIVTLRASAPVGYSSVLPETPDAAFERRWTAWQARGLAHDRVIRQRFIIVGILAGAIALAAPIAYGLLAA